MVLNVHRNHKSYYGRGEEGEEGTEVGERESIYLQLHCHRQNDSCIKMGSDESHFNVSFIVRDKGTCSVMYCTAFCWTTWYRNALVCCT